ncbi:CaiB/BaiF CoA-transferase family protein [Piscinibacter sp. XHJ-5]|uniref:CaiB/BaiF CoA transferase family protein n=1 Tax=Piscinibacter sp. XHJ-5 TaxID=3037797 RepID=UPI002452EF83|nr:CaiB/BaiF CoA-transferase family protein [Piscinibacter sp. XHJ-5]
MSRGEPPLRGVRVLDLTRLVPGPVCTQHLADLGADVVKVEDTGAGDYAPPALRALVNRNKRGLQLDLKQPAGAEAFLLLARGADVVVEGFRPGAMARLGLGYDEVAVVNPRIVYCSLTGYGQSGPYHDRPGHDLNYCGHAGVADQIGVDTDRLALSNIPIADLLGGALTAAMGILAALFDAARTGRGRHVDIAMAEGALAHAVMPLATLAARGSTRRAGSDTLTGGLACYALYRTADERFLAVGALERKFWEALCDVVERADLKPLHRTGDAGTESHLRDELAAIFGARPLAHWASRFAHADCCVSPVHTVEEALADPHFRARGMVVDSVHPDVGPLTQVASPVKMSRHEFELRRHAPRPGEHTVELLREAGCDDETIAAWLEKGVARAS